MPVTDQRMFFENPIDREDMKLTKIAVAVIFVLGILTCLYYWSAIPIITALLAIGVIWAWNWHRMVYLNPKLVIVDQPGITMEFRYGDKKRFVPWPNVTGLWISTKPNTVAQAVVECVGMRAVIVTKEIGLAVQQKYREVMGRDAPEWI